uniref:Ankyrin repeat and SOCS box containing 2 n=1 Tax=Eptatretus burgeri TaxID=7764 RepID=A0A8C4Q763_EPTBU
MATGAWQRTGPDTGVLGADDLSLYGSMSEEELVHMAIEQSLIVDTSHGSHKQTSNDSTTYSVQNNPSSSPVYDSNRMMAHTCAGESPSHGSTSPIRRGFMQWRSIRRQLLQQQHEMPGPLSLAIMEDDSAQLSQLLAKDVDLTIHSAIGMLPVHEAAFLGKPNCLKVMLQVHPSCMNSLTKHHDTPLSLATTQEQVECMKILLEAGASPNLRGSRNETPLYKACENNNNGAMQLLLKFGADVNVCGNHGHTPLFEAISKNNKDMVELLVAAGAKIEVRNNFGLTPMFLAAACGRLDILKYLHALGTDVDTEAKDGATALYEACKNEHEDIVEFLLSIGANANKANNKVLMPLHIASSKGNEDIVCMLLPKTSNVRVKRSGISPLHFATEHGHHDIMEMLINHGYCVNAELSIERSHLYEDRRSTPLYFAVANGDLEAAHILLEAGADPERDFLRPLLVAVQMQDISLARLLLTYGASLEPIVPSLPMTFPTPFFFAARGLRMLKLLLDWGTNADTCFHCDFGAAPHPVVPNKRRRDWLMNDRPHPLQDIKVVHEFLPCSLQHVCVHQCACSCNLRTKILQFCEFLSSSELEPWSGPIIAVLLDYIGNVRLCSRLKEHLDSFEEWAPIRETADNPRPLAHICRLMIRRVIGRRNLRRVTRLPVPKRLQHYILYKTDME